MLSCGFVVVSMETEHNFEHNTYSGIIKEKNIAGIAQKNEHNSEDPIHWLDLYPTESSSSCGKGTQSL